ncbi:GNAT family N-acetyltransferase [Bacillus sp. FJAT-49711]|uniref:GNAT family N-acetyltransferase n=1 Tax=Bacillus sp. FJAT-49711 TaxID=2833585 RepID=UPI001BC94132|nr:GNAT family N-acetyltransferase [Bacillus sp. FJAT-49711]MBS4220646.1 GNAT family N-acetyltransferase [Bacillus sp. FJAT-49711]
MIREAEISDKEQICELYRMLVPKKRDRNNFLLVYDKEGEILGTLTLNICLQALHGMGPYGIVENIVVHEKHRSKKIGQKLMQYVEDFCKLKDCHKIMLLSSSKRQRAYQFWAGYNGSVSKGFKKYL